MEPAMINLRDLALANIVELNYILAVPTEQFRSKHKVLEAKIHFQRGIHRHGVHLSQISIEIRTQASRYPGLVI